MRVIVCLFLLLPGCATHAVRCDGHLHPINPKTLDSEGRAAAAGAADVVPEKVP